MKLKDKIKPSDPPLEEDMYDAVCVMVVDIGQQIDQKSQKVKNQIVFVFEIPSETVERDGEMVPRQLSRWFTYTASDRGALKPALRCTTAYPACSAWHSTLTTPSVSFSWRF